MRIGRNIKIYMVVGVLLAQLVGLFFQVPTAVAAESAGYQYIVKLTSNTLPEELLLDGNNIERQFAFTESSEFTNIYTFESPKSLSQLEKKLQGKYEYIELDRAVRNSDISVSSLVTTNDPGYTANASDIDKQWGLVKTSFPEAWEKTTGSKDSVIAIIDTGIDATHEDLDTISFLRGYNAVTKQSIEPGTNSDDNGHGTLVAGVLGATPNNGRGIVGINWQLSILPIKALDENGRGNSSGISESIVWATDNGADIINLSLGGMGFGHDITLANAIEYAFKKDVVIVAAAGNDSAESGENLDEKPVYPICDDNNSNMIIGVVAVDQNDRKPAFSNFGKTCVDVSAPGKRILSTINHDPLSRASAANSYAYGSGTSLATPFVSGLAALIKAKYPLATNEQIRDRIISSTDFIDNNSLSECKNQSCRGLLGSGRINAAKSLASDIVSQEAKEGELVTSPNSQTVYYILGGQKRIVSTFVQNQRFLEKTPRVISDYALSQLPEGSYALPNEGTLVKIEQSPAVYMIFKGRKLAVSLQTFQQRNLSFSNVQTVSFSELNSWPDGGRLSPLDGTLVKTARRQTVYWTVDGTLHPVNRAFYLDRGLNVFPILQISEQELQGLSKGEAYIK